MDSMHIFLVNYTHNKKGYIKRKKESRVKRTQSTYCKSKALAFVSEYLSQRNSPKLGLIKTEEDGSSSLIFTSSDEFLYFNSTALSS